jgi:glyoxylase-like metal-dependent hydrolase (beta-lactamase superfamily II)
MMAGESASGMYVLRLGGNLLGFYDGRGPAAASAPIDNWVDDGALSLGICSFAIVDDAEAIVYDTHVSVAHARRIREAVEQLGARSIRVVLSHWHLDHIAGTEAFADCEIIANATTAALMAEHCSAIEAGTHEGPPAISPLILPTTVFESRLRLELPSFAIEFVEFDIHSRDATVVHLPHAGILLAGDTVEDTVTYVSEPDRLEAHIAELERMRGLGARTIFPNHGSREIIEAGGYAPTLIDATQQYVRNLLGTASDSAEQHADLRAFVGEELAAGWISWFEPYERVHQSNLAAVRSA